ncbi:EscU/YscU/HrcU family type III secretion system export apparatus switch protein [Magnetospirillum sp. SS-4]|uniref:EscU/YscU/HrcU family type III secretion system export apparatus switch protein n=1 Tax=Magnetospirillum sp. SS-4 TaxID=2681465 RepID=UPI00137C773D|nr:EscU/YscU/HrcU family type III secretion system export apparatus switch protein [Magnetospirillum sp. SS-4]CAA7617520.1 Flagellar protein FhlB cytoplasmic domain-containing protein [Magnetospirillum sp. SS-4]
MGGKGKDLWNEHAEAAGQTGRRPGRAVAVALHHDPDQPDLPKVVASGRGGVAEQILELAFAHGVKVRTDPDLAEVLAAVEVDTVIPVEAFVAVAEILAYVYRANGRATAADRT